MARAPYGLGALGACPGHVPAARFARKREPTPLATKLIRLNFPEFHYQDAAG